MASSDFSIVIDKKDISEIRSYAKPPAAVVQVVSATALLLGQPEQHAQVSDLVFILSC